MTKIDVVAPAMLTTNARDGVDLAPSGRGNTIVFMSNRDGNWQVYSVPLAGGTATNLTNAPGDNGLAKTRESRPCVGFETRIVSGLHAAEEGEIGLLGRLTAGQAEAPWLLHRNPLFHRWFASFIARAARAEGAELVHAQNKGALVGAHRAARALGLPLAVTVRDLGLLCPVGACPLFEPWTTFDCSTEQYRTRCVPYFLAHYAAGDGWLRRARRHVSRPSA